MMPAVALAVMLATLPAADAPPACVAAAIDAPAAVEAYEALASARLAPLCAEPAPAGEDWRLRRTITWRPEHRWVLEVATRRGRVHVRVVDTLFQPSESTAFVSRLSPSRLRHELDEEGWSALWTAEDPVCAATSVTMEIGTVWESYDASGYRARLGPRAQFCDTPYKQVIHDLSELLDEVVLGTRRR